MEDNGRFNSWEQQFNGSQQEMALYRRKRAY